MLRVAFRGLTHFGGLVVLDANSGKITQDRSHRRWREWITFPRLAVLKQHGVLEVLQESFWLKGVDRDHGLRVDLLDEFNDVIVIDVAAGMSFDQVA